MVNSGFTGKLLDRYLASGWYRMGPRMFTCRYNFYPNGFLTTVWTRLPLAGHAFPKRLAKTMRRNDARFSHTVRPAQAGEAEERVFAAYRATKSYDLYPRASHYLLQDVDVPFDTLQVSVFDGDRLVAFSYFDRGESALQSVCGYYDPAYDRYSLGLYTMAIEIEEAKRWGMDYHYAGYIVPGNDTFEYKRRVGNLEAFDDAARSWYPIAEMDADELPDAVGRGALLEYDALYRNIQRSYGLCFKPTIQIPFGRMGLSWLRREQLPFCIFDDTVLRRPFWACHFFSYNYRRYFTLLCTDLPMHGPDGAMDPSAEDVELQDLMHGHNPGSGLAVECLHFSKYPYTAADLERTRRAVDEANAFALEARYPEPPQVPYQRRKRRGEE